MSGADRRHGGLIAAPVMESAAPLRIALVHRDLHEVTRGGICTVYRALAAELTRRGHRVVLITQASPSPLHDPPAAELVTLPRSDDLAAYARAVSGVLDRLAPDVAECSSWEHELLDYAARPRTRRAAVVVRGDVSARTMGAAQLVADEARLLRAADAVLAVSDFAAADLRDAYGVAAATVPNGVDRERFRPAPSERPSSGYAVTLGRTGAVTAQRSLPDLLADHGERFDWFRARAMRVAWIGKATKMKGWDRLQALAARLPDHVRLLIVLGHGQVHYPIDLPAPPRVLVVRDLADCDMPCVYTAADWLLSTSRWEGFGLAIAEAAACGTPALVPVDLAVAKQFATAGASTYRSTDELLHRLAERPATTAELSNRYDWRGNAHATLAVYRQLVAG